MKTQTLQKISSNTAFAAVASSSISSLIIILLTRVLPVFASR